MLWGYSYSGGHVIELAAADPEIAGVLTIAPFIDSWQRVRNMPAPQITWLLARAGVELLRRNTVVPVTARADEPGVMTLAGEADGFAQIVSAGSAWRNAVSAGAVLGMVTHRPVRKAARITMPLWVGLCRYDNSVSAAAIRRLVERAQHSTLRTYPLDHFGPFTDTHAKRVVGDQIDFLQQHRLL